MWNRSLQSSHGVVSPAGETGTESSTPDSVTQEKPAFKWTGDDAVAASAIASALTELGHAAHAFSIIETAVELDGQIRAPREVDAWRFFQAARVFEGRGGLFPTFTNGARRLGRRIALAVLGVEVIECHRIDAGSSTAFVYRNGAELPRVEIFRPMGAP